MTEYYDLVLGLIPLTFFGLGGGLHVAGITMTNALMIGSLITVGIVGHALFVNGPVSLSESRGQQGQATQSAPINTAD